MAPYWFLLLPYFDKTLLPRPPPSRLVPHLPPAGLPLYFASQKKLFIFESYLQLRIGEWAPAVDGGSVLRRLCWRLKIAVMLSYPRQKKIVRWCMAPSRVPLSESVQYELVPACSRKECIYGWSGPTKAQWFTFDEYHSKFSCLLGWINQGFLWACNSRRRDLYNMHFIKRQSSNRINCEVPVQELDNWPAKFFSRELRKEKRPSLAWQNFSL